ncbi:MAG: type I-E CRISPR-associated protein Cas5/CasD [Bacteroidetes bacterium]|jgi:CRISPR system Cascade subunit CasD|nr:type I-E CRISPR-associated protein Cas5/CasD [Bacteroidota bacterium]
MDVLILRLDAPLLSFGAPIIDRHGKVQSYPALSMIAGLLGNALGYDHSDHKKLESLQSRLSYASRQDRAGRELRDYQTVDLSQEFMLDQNAWTTEGWLDKRKGGSSSKGTHIRLRDYRADSVHTVALTLQPADAPPTLDDLQNALQYPERPLFIGRKTCLPASSLFVERFECRSLTNALQKTPLSNRADQRKSYPAWWPVSDDKNQPRADIEQPVTDRRDWKNQIHVGERWIARGEIEIQTEE